MGDQTGVRSGPLDVRRLALGLSVLAVAGVASFAGSVFIATRYPARPMPRDTLFELLPHISWVRYLTAVALVGAFALFLVYAFTRRRERLPGFAAMFGLMYLLRGVIMVLTPLANSHGEGAFVFPMVQNGMFPSGHSAAALLCALLIAREDAPRLKQAVWALAATVWIALIVSHGHYSIDVVGGILLAYFVVAEWTNGRLFGPLRRALEAP